MEYKVWNTTVIYHGSAEFPPLSNVAILTALQNGTFELTQWGDDLIVIRPKAKKGNR